MLAKVALSALVTLTLIVAGCTTVQKGSTVVRYDKGTQPILAEAPLSGTYALYGSTDTTPRVTYNLEAGDKLGFRRDDDRLEAVAGDHEVPLDSGTYYWRKRQGVSPNRAK